MISRIAFLLLLAALPIHCQENNPPAVEGYITRVTSPTDLDVDGMHILFSPKTEIGSTLIEGPFRLQSAAVTMPYLGQTVQIYGAKRKKIHSIAASRVILQSREQRDVSGSGIVDALLSPPAPGPGGDYLLRADGYPVRVTAKTAITFAPPLDSASAFRPNVWISFHGRQGPDGVVVADHVTFTANTISHGEDKLRTKGEYDPDAVDPNAKQGAFSKAFRGIDPKQIPPYHDDAMQARISTIGEKLIPKYQRNLSDGDETKIDFRFRVIDRKGWRFALSLASGIILVPRQVVERMQNDSQLAAVLADSIAGVIEKENLHVQSATRKMTAAETAGDVAGAFVPGLGLATIAANAGAASVVMNHVQQRCGRVSLSLLHDAGYDIEQAPLAWWLLASKKPTSVEDIPLPSHAAYLYKTLGETWSSH